MTVSGSTVGIIFALCFALAGCNSQPSQSAPVDTTIAADVDQPSSNLEDEASNKSAAEQIQEDATADESSEDVLSVINDDWLVGRWYNTARSPADCSAEEGEAGYFAYNGDHSFKMMESDGMWLLDGPMLRLNGSAEGEEFSSDAIITRASPDGFATRDADGFVNEYQRCTL